MFCWMLRYRNDSSVAGHGDFVIPGRVNDMIFNPSCQAHPEFLEIATIARPLLCVS